MKTHIYMSFAIKLCTSMLYKSSELMAEMSFSDLWLLSGVCHKFFMILPYNSWDEFQLKWHNAILFKGILVWFSEEPLHLPKGDN